MYCTECSFGFRVGIGLSSLMFELLSLNELKLLSSDSKRILSKILSSKTWEQSDYVRWLRETEPKQYIWDKFYRELLEKNAHCVLDVGGGISPLTAHYINACEDYHLSEVLCHDQVYFNLIPHLRDHITIGDWFLFPEKNWDIIIANDLFPNADQRLSLFLEKFLPHCRELRLSLTFYNHPRFYATKRLDADEHLTYLAYSGRLSQWILSDYADRIDGFHEKAEVIFSADPKESLYPNGRHVALVSLRGDLEEW